MSTQRFAVYPAILVAISATSSLAAPPGAKTGLNFRVGALDNNAPQAVYAPAPSDAWNRIFQSLFTRTISVRLSNEFADAAPLEERAAGRGPNLRISIRTFERIEGGDRAIEPFDSFLVHSGFHARSPLFDEAAFNQFTRALDDALHEKSRRSPLARALMQSDLWAAYDFLAASKSVGGEESQRKEQLLESLARLIGTLALTSDEIAGLPDNYEEARLPFHLFTEEGGWIEVEHRPKRVHEITADDRRVSRVFLKPANPRADRAAWLEALHREPRRLDGLEAVALVVQLLLIDNRFVVVPSKLTYEVQVRTFRGPGDTPLKQVELAVAELSRKELLLDARSGGLRQVEDRAPSYLPRAGNDYGMVFPVPGAPEVRPPTLVSLRSRCQSCHDEDLKRVVTLLPAVRGDLPIRALRTTDNDRAGQAAERKIERNEFKALVKRLRSLATP